MTENKFDDIKEELSESGEKTGIEAEDDNDVIEPFDPEKISIQQRVVSMDVIIRRLKQGSIEISPSFQRKEVWDNTRKSRLIESLMLNIPLPMFYVSADEEGNWEVVDGLQRLSTIRDFIIGDRNGVPLKLKNLEFLGEKYNGKTFRGIEANSDDQKLVNGIYETEMRFTVINPGTPEAVKRNIFKRINTGGMPLTGQEIRHALYEGQSSVLLQELVKLESLQQAIGKTMDDSRMGASELILRLIAFMVMDRQFYKHGMDTWLSNAMRVINYFPDLTEHQLQKIFQNNGIPDIKTTSISEVKTRFNLAMTRAAELFNGHAFRKSLPGDSRKSPINKSLFEVWGNLLGDLSEKDFNMLISKKEELLSQYSELFYDTDFSNDISRHSSTPRGVMDAYEKIEYLVRNLIKGEYH